MINIATASNPATQAKVAKMLHKDNQTRKDAVQGCRHCFIPVVV